MKRSSKFMWLMLALVLAILIVIKLDNTTDLQEITQLQLKLESNKVKQLQLDSITYADSIQDLHYKLARIYKLTWDNIDYWLDYFEVEQQEIVKQQIFLETGNLSSKICIENRNLFGMRMPSVRETTAIKKQHGHALYSNYIMSIEDYAIWQKRFYDGEEDYYEFLTRVGYATEPTYIERLKTVPEFKDEVIKYAEVCVEELK